MSTAAACTPGNVRRQIATTLDKVEALLAQENAGLHDFAAATIFLKRREDAPVFWEMMAHCGLAGIPGRLRRRRRVPRRVAF